MFRFNLLTKAPFQHIPLGDDESFRAYQLSNIITRCSLSWDGVFKAKEFEPASGLLSLEVSFTNHPVITQDVTWHTTIHEPGKFAKVHKSKMLYPMEIILDEFGGNRYYSDSVMRACIFAMMFHFNSYDPNSMLLYNWNSERFIRDSPEIVPGVLPSDLVFNPVYDRFQRVEKIVSNRAGFGLEVIEGKADDFYYRA